MQKVKYLGARIIIKSTGSAFVDYPAKDSRISIKASAYYQKINHPNKHGMLKSWPKRYRVHYAKGPLSKLFSDIEQIMP